MHQRGGQDRGERKQQVLCSEAVGAGETYSYQDQKSSVTLGHVTLPGLTLLPEINNKHTITRHID